MKVTELKVGESYYLGGHRWELISKGQGHGDVHNLRQLDLETGVPVRNNTMMVERRCSSRDLQETWGTFIARNPTYIQNVKQRKIDAEARAEEVRLAKEFSEKLGLIAQETAGLLCALGFEAEAKQISPYSNNPNWVIQIDNPTENQEFLRDLVAKKWGM